MPQKFLGERISSSVDAIRPASMVLTDEMLQCIPKYNFTELDIPNDCGTNQIHSPCVGTRLSRKYGGTLYLKKRLQSVPALFLKEQQRRNRNSHQNQCHSQGQYHNVSSITNRDREKRVLQREMNRTGTVMFNGTIPKKDWEGIPQPQPPLQPQRQRCSQGNLTDVSQTHRTLRSASEFEKFYNTHNCNTTNDLFEEIISIYCDESNALGNDTSSEVTPTETPEPTALQNQADVLYREVEIMMDRIQKQQNIFEMNRRLSIDNNNNGDSVSSLESTPSETQLNRLSDLHSISGSPANSHTMPTPQYHNSTVPLMPTQPGQYRITHSSKHSNTSSSTDDASYRTASDKLPPANTEETSHYEPVANRIANMAYVLSPGIEMKKLRRTTIDPPQIMVLDYDDVSETAPLEAANLDYDKGTPYTRPIDMVSSLEAKIDQISFDNDNDFDDDDGSLHDQSSSVYS